MIIKKVSNKNEALECDKLLTKLINSEKEFNKNINDNFIVKNYFTKLYNKNNNAIFIAVEDSRVVGYIYIKITKTDNGPEINHEALIDGLYVEEEYRNQKIATKLIKEAKKWAVEKEVKYISISVLIQNEIASKLYYQLGFKDFSINLKQEL